MKLDDSSGKKVQNFPSKYVVLLEEEACQSVSQTIPVSQKISKIFLNYFGHENGIDLEMENQRKFHEPLKFNR